MSLSSKRKARKGMRSTPSGRLLPTDTPLPKFWPEIVADSREQFNEKFGRDYPQAEYEPRPTEYVEAEPGKQYFGVSGRITAGPVQHIGKTNRAARRERLRSVRGGRMILGSYTRELHRQAGEAMGNHWEAKRLMRERNRAAREAAKYEAVAS